MLFRIGAHCHTVPVDAYCHTVPVDAHCHTVPVDAHHGLLSEGNKVLNTLRKGSFKRPFPGFLTILTL